MQAEKNKAEIWREGRREGGINILVVKVRVVSRTVCFWPSLLFITLLNVNRFHPLKLKKIK